MGMVSCSLQFALHVSDPDLLPIGLVRMAEKEDVMH
jgi:hypothetical protein